MFCPPDCGSEGGGGDFKAAILVVLPSKYSQHLHIIVEAINGWEVISLCSNTER